MSNSTITEYQRSTSRTIIVGLIITVLIPSYFCFFFIFYSCIHIPRLRKSRQNRIILILLIVLFIQALFDSPCRLFYLHNGTVPFHNEIFCQIWYLLVTITNVIALHLMALASIERYFLVFHHVFLTRYHLFLSTIPMIIFIVYPTVWYLTIVYSSTWCTYKPNYGVIQCGIPCPIVMSTFNLSFIIYVHHLLPIFTTTFANLYLIVSVLHQKAKMKRNNSWRKGFRMTSQLLSIAFLYLTVWLPHCILASFPLFTKGELTSRARFFNTEYFENFLSFFVCLCPFIALIGFPQLNNKIKQIATSLPHLCNKRMAVVSSTTDRHV